jgi:hypothetical protein
MATLAEGLGHLYAIWTLDCLIEIGYAVSVDFITRPQLYLSDDIPDDIVDLRMSYGTAAPFPNTAQRQALMMPIFGRSDGFKPDASTGTAPFHIARKKFVDACIAFSERAVDTGIAMLEERVLSALVPLRAHFEALLGKSMQLTTTKQMNAMSNTVTSILQAPGVAKVFGVSPAEKGWPFDSDDSDGAKLVENTGAGLPLPQECKLGYTKFILLQRVAREGAQALPLVLTDISTSDELLPLISRGYSWGSSLRDFQQMP